MQKIDFVKSLEIIIDRLQSEIITKYFDASFATPADNYPFQNINPHLFTSKSNFEQIKNNPLINEIILPINAEEIYIEQNLARLSAAFTQKPAAQIVFNPNVLEFYILHKSLLAMLKLSKRVLLNETLVEGFEENLNNGVLLFQIVIESEGLETEKYIKILSVIEELTEVIAKVEGESEDKSEIVILDSGSDTNLGLKTGVETAKSLFLIFKEVWDWVINYKHYKQNVANKTLMDSLTIRAKIKKQVEAGVITEEEGRKYAHLIKTRTEDLISMKVMPKEIVSQSIELQNKKLLSDFEGYKMLSQGDN